MPNDDSVYRGENTRGREAEIKFQSRKDRQEAWRRRRCPQQPCSYTGALRTQILWYTSRADEVHAWQTMTGAGKASPDSELSHSL